jgi:hypothetical protein
MTKTVEGCYFRLQPDSTMMPIANGGLWFTKDDPACRLFRQIHPPGGNGANVGFRLTRPIK